MHGRAQPAHSLPAIAEQDAGDLHGPARKRQIDVSGIARGHDQGYSSEARQGRARLPHVPHPGKHTGVENATAAHVHQPAVPGLADHQLQPVVQCLPDLVRKHSAVKTRLDTAHILIPKQNRHRSILVSHQKLRRSCRTNSRPAVPSPVSNQRWPARAVAARVESNRPSPRVALRSPTGSSHPNPHWSPKLASGLGLHSGKADSDSDQTHAGRYPR